MTTEERARFTLEVLKTKALSGAPSEVETALGRLRGDAAIAAAEEAAKIALEAKKWANLAYLADFLADVTTPHPPVGGGNGSDGDDGDYDESVGESGDEGGAESDKGEPPVVDLLALVAPEESTLADKVLAMYTVDLDDLTAQV